MSVATITLESSNGDSVVVSGPQQKWTPDYLEDDIILDVDPQGIYDTGFKVHTQSGAFETGGRIVRTEVPIRELTLPFHLTKASRPRFQRLWGTPGNFRKVRYIHDGESGPRWLWLKLSKEILYTTEDGHDAGIGGDYHAVVTAMALNPMYESAEDVQEWSNPSSGSNTGWFELWNPTDQFLYPEWTFDPADEWRFPDRSFGQERRINRPTSADAYRQIVTPELVSKLSVMTDPMMDSYVSADLSNITPLFNGVYPLYGVPPYTGTEDSPVMVPVLCDGPAGATATLRLRRFWSAESGLDQ
ncbi:hypothetical protein [Mycolicibacterium sp. F2034L]|uniref:hypothetical protein n=1 Tax=Mycolicibacterium sp. F2034L TaxID=2926422 RepID=UPI001FF30503|nr:hypothetical protein [Mycolicibacterium sp. F2034L]MCK0174808.1 hypothetical protein [Mycolicibacterium sp. F2034L]